MIHRFLLDKQSAESTYKSGGIDIDKCRAKSITSSIDKIPELQLHILVTLSLIKTSS